MKTDTTTIPFVRSIMVGESEQDVMNAEERFIAFASLIHRIGTRLSEEDEVP